MYVITGNYQLFNNDRYLPWELLFTPKKFWKYYLRTVVYSTHTNTIHDWSELFLSKKNDQSRLII